MEGEVVGLLGVALEKSRLRGGHVHYVEERRVGQQLDVLVRARRGGGDESVLAGALEVPHELPEGLGAAEAAEDGRLVEARHRELRRVELPVANGLVIRQVDALGLGRVDPLYEARDR